MLKYGWRYNPVKFAKDALSGDDSGNAALAACYPLMLAAALASLGIERLGLRTLGREEKVGRCWAGAGAHVGRRTCRAAHPWCTVMVLPLWHVPAYAMPACPLPPTHHASWHDLPLCASLSVGPGVHP